MDDINLSMPSVSFFLILPDNTKGWRIWPCSAGVYGDVEVPATKEVRITDSEVIGPWLVSVLASEIRKLAHPAYWLFGESNVGGDAHWKWKMDWKGCIEIGNPFLSLAQNEKYDHGIVCGVRIVGLTLSSLLGLVQRRLEIDWTGHVCMWGEMLKKRVGFQGGDRSLSLILTSFRFKGLFLVLWHWPNWFRGLSPHASLPLLFNSGFPRAWSLPAVFDCYTKTAFSDLSALYCVEIDL